MVAIKLRVALYALLSLASARVMVFPEEDFDLRRDASHNAERDGFHPGRSLTTTSTATNTYVGRPNSAPTTSTSSSSSSSSRLSSTTTAISSSKTTSTTSSSSSSSTKPSTTSTRSTTTTTAASSSASSSSSTSAGPIVTDTAYINTVIRHHNVHRANHSANALSWSSSLADTARKIAQSCYYAHNTTADGGGYGQNIAAGYIGTQIGAPITLGFYNSEVNAYSTYYGNEPNMTTFGSYGHFTQIVWKSTTTVGCYTMDCTAQGLKNVPAGVMPYFTVCNYGPPGNYVGEFAKNVGSPLGNPTVYANYGCPSNQNCA